jgi:hypothetical protein
LFVHSSVLHSISLEDVYNNCSGAFRYQKLIGILKKIKIKINKQYQTNNTIKYIYNPRIHNI